MARDRSALNPGLETVVVPSASTPLDAPREDAALATREAGRPWVALAVALQSIAGEDPEWVLQMAKRAKLLLLGSGLFLAVDFMCWHRSIDLIGPGLSTLLANFQVFFMALAGVLFLGEKLSPRLAVSIPLALFGLFLVVGIQWDRLGGDYKLGIYASLSAAVCFTLFLLSLRRIQNMENPLSTATNLTYITVFTALFVALDVWRQGDSFRIPDMQSFLALGAYGITSQAVGWLIITRALPKIRASLVGMILLLQPALAFVWDMLFFNRETTGVGLFGIALTLGAIYLGVTAKPIPPGKPGVR